MSRTKLIGLTGRARAGKTTAAQSILDRGYADYDYALASPVKAMLKVIGFDPEDPFWEENKTAPVPLLAGRSYREAMQTLGTEWGRALNPNIWVTLADMVRASMPDQRMLVTDVRYDNEAEFIKNNGGILIEITRPDLAQDAHSSESGINRKYIDFTVINDGTLEQLDLALLDVFHGCETGNTISAKDK